MPRRVTGRWFKHTVFNVHVFIWKEKLAAPPPPPLGQPIYYLQSDWPSTRGHPGPRVNFLISHVNISFLFIKKCMNNYHYFFVAIIVSFVAIFVFVSLIFVVVFVVVVAFNIIGCQEKVVGDGVKQNKTQLSLKGYLYNVYTVTFVWSGWHHIGKPRSSTYNHSASGSKTVTR